jgi:hypothetical protein
LSSTCRLHSKLEALDFEVERAAEEELFQSQADDGVDAGGSNTGSYEEDD